MNMSEENIDNNRNKDSLPVTVIVKRIVKKNKIKEFEEWLSGINREVSRQNGSMGIDIIRPTDKESKPEYVIIFRFDNYGNLTKWENSSIRNEWLKKGRELVQSDPDVQKLTGLEFWFTPYPKKEFTLNAVRFAAPVQNGHCYYSCYRSSSFNSSSSNTFYR
jgi:uncharacterized protein